jgi:hypothetical protein
MQNGKEAAYSQLRAELVRYDAKTVIRLDGLKFSGVDFFFMFQGTIRSGETW